MSEGKTFQKLRVFFPDSKGHTPQVLSAPSLTGMSRRDDRRSGNVAKSFILKWILRPVKVQIGCHRRGQVAAAGEMDGSNIMTRPD